LCFSVQALSHRSKLSFNPDATYTYPITTLNSVKSLAMLAAFSNCSYLAAPGTARNNNTLPSPLNR